LVRGLQLSEIDEKWEYLLPGLKRVLAYNDRYSCDDIKALLKESKAQLFYTSSSFCVTEIIQYPRIKVLNIFLMSGDMAAIDCLGMIEQWAITQGCSEIEETGRRGWVKILYTLGYEQTTITMRKRL